MENGDILTWGDKDWSNTSLYQPSPDWYPFEGLPIQNARAIEYNSGEGIRYILGETGLVLSSKAKSGNVIDRSAGPIYDIACDQFSQE